MTTMSDVRAVLDVRSLPCTTRRATIFGTFDALESGQAFEIVNDHDPAPLRGHFDARADGSYDWTYVEAGPREWRVRITRG
ncbi:DUF2249 domain-containing protein [Jiella sp. 40Bstr34]|uniref:DUF2249 domain-containing protein n=2 Tax=Jiella pacifica TaxID=2696469 RepID=A0A6N9T8Q6_9HYPH|nr:DUF2249 domain-containing protein [Jiella pacifica]